MLAILRRFLSRTAVRYGSTDCRLRFIYPVLTRQSLTLSSTRLDILGGQSLRRLIKRGWISFEDGTSENNRRAKYYRLTARGRKQLELETSRWETLARAIARILRPAAQE